MTPSEICLAFLEALGARDLERAQGLVADGFEMVFPGEARFTEFADLVDWATPRYRRIAKTIERVEETAAGETVAVYISGTLHGERPDGTPFADIRFIDRFEVRGGLIDRQEVWNDLAETGVT